MPKRILSVLSCLAVLVVLLGLGAFHRQGIVDAVGTGVIMNEFVRVRRAPDPNAEIAAVLRGGQEVTILADENNFYQITAEIKENGKESGEIVEGYVRKDLILLKTIF